MLLLLLIPVCGFSQKMTYKNDVKFRIGVMKMIVERKKTDENKFRDAQYKLLDFLTFSDSQKNTLDTLFSNSWNKRLALFENIKKPDNREDNTDYIKYLLKYEMQFRSQLTTNQRILYNSVMINIEKKADTGEKALLKGLFFSDEKYSEYVKKNE